MLITIKNNIQLSIFIELCFSPSKQQSFVIFSVRIGEYKLIFETEEKKPSEKIFQEKKYSNLKNIVVPNVVVENHDSV